MIIAGTIDLRGELLKNVVTLLSSEKFTSIFGDVAFQRLGSELRFAAGGSILFGVYGQPKIGKGCDLCIVDDPQPPERARSAKQREETNRYFDASLRPRMNRTSDGKIVVVQQRLHENDLSGHLQGQGGWHTLAIPAIALHNESYVIEGGVSSRYSGQPIGPERESREELRARLYEIGGVEFEPQYQQSPDPGENPPEISGYCVYTLPGEGDDPATFSSGMIFA